MPLPAPAPFISYSRVDAAFAMKLAEDLAAGGAAVWLDQLSIQPGTQWVEAIEHALKATSCVLLILSPASVKSRNVMDEINFALDEHKTLIPILYQDCEVPWRLRTVQHIDFRTDYNRGLRLLLANLSSRRTEVMEDIQPGQFGSSSEARIEAPLKPRPPLQPPLYKNLKVAIPAATLTLALAFFFAFHRSATPPDTSKLDAPAQPPVSAFDNDPQRGFTPLELARLYNFPDHLDGTGQTIAMIELGGGYRMEDLKAYFQQLHLPLPNVTSVAVDGGSNLPTTSNSPDSQVVMNIEVAGAIAPKANLVVYFAPNSNQGFIDAVRAAANNKKNPSTVMLICWGSPESTWTPQAASALNDALQDAAANHHITTLVASGDNGIDDGLRGQRAADFPASSPWVLAVGGTALTVEDGKITSETVWNRTAQSQGATGGGVSKKFPQPDWQRDAHIPAFFGESGRAIPDIVASADTHHGYVLRVDGKTVSTAGTSASASLWAGFIAILNQGLGRDIGYANPVLYGSVGPSGAFNDITQGNNSTSALQGCTAAKGWDYCTGWGSPNGLKLLDAFRAVRP